MHMAKINENEPPELSPRQERCALNLASGLSIEKSAREAGVAAITIKAWLRETPAFRSRIRELRALLTEEVLGILIGGMVDASWTLRRLLKSKNEMMRHRAAESLLSHGA